VFSFRVYPCVIQKKNKEKQKYIVNKPNKRWKDKKQLSKKIHNTYLLNVLIVYLLLETKLKIEFEGGEDLSRESERIVKMRGKNELKAFPLGFILCFYRQNHWWNIK
jgi:hypothetical protein